MYKRYGGRGIQFHLTVPDVRFLYERDRADLLERPSLDRINADLNYTIDNCQFMELSDNIAKSARETAAKRKLVA